MSKVAVVEFGQFLSCGSGSLPLKFAGIYVVHQDKKGTGCSFEVVKDSFVAAVKLYGKHQRISCCDLSSVAKAVFHQHDRNSLCDNMIVALWISAFRKKTVFCCKRKCVLPANNLVESDEGAVGTGLEPMMWRKQEYFPHSCML